MLIRWMLRRYYIHLMACLGLVLAVLIPWKFRAPGLPAVGDACDAPSQTGAPVLVSRKHFGDWGETLLPDPEIEFGLVSCVMVG